MQSWGNRSRVLLRLTLALWCIVFFSSPAAFAQPPIEAYGALPTVRSMAISPDGTKLGYIAALKDGEALVMTDLTAGEIKPLTGVTDLKAGSVDFVTNDVVVFQGSVTTSQAGFRGEFEFSTAFLHNLSTDKTVQALRRNEELHPAQSGLGDYVSIDREKRQLYMPAFVGSGGGGTRFSLMRVNLRSGRGREIVPRGYSTTIDWFMSKDNEILAREDFDEDRSKHRISAYKDGKFDVIYERDTDRPSLPVVGVHPNGKELIVSRYISDTERFGLFAMSLEDGSFRGPLFDRENADVESVLTDSNRTVYGVRFSGMLPGYEFFDETVTNDMNLLVQNAGFNAVYLNGWSEDWSRLLILTEGASTAGKYQVFIREQRQLLGVAQAREGVPDNQVAPVQTIEYKARDGLTIPAVLTWPLGATPGQAKNLPTVVFPHGGPEAYDRVQFDYMAQMFASKGYLVLQPNFRGSTGFGIEFRDKGRGEWGRKMQDDVTDGTKALIEMGWADPERICIAGWSYGGYAALAGGAYTPDLYRCVIAGAPVSDLPYSLIETRRDFGTRHPVFSYWKELIGDPRAERDALRAISPVFAAENFKAPVLLIHGQDDTVVAYEHTRRMERALKRADKEVEVVRMRQADHWLTTRDTRIQAITAMSDFLDEHLPAN